jgi:CRP-like cAMP-binding protein
VSNRERLEVLRAVDALSGADGATLSALLPFFDEVTVPAGTVVAREGSLCHELVVVAGGELEVCRRGRASRMGIGGAFGWTEMRDRARHDATVLAVLPSRLLVMSHAQFRAASGVI